jgi:hypothetical protein
MREKSIYIQVIHKLNLKGCLNVKTWENNHHAHFMDWPQRIVPVIFFTNAKKFFTNLAIRYLKNNMQ